MPIFISYARQDWATVEALARELERSRTPVWLDQQPFADPVRWDVILGQIRSCDLYIFALSPGSLASRTCNSELEYALSLNRPVLPVLIQDVDSSAIPTEIADLPTVDYRVPDVDQGVALLAAVLDRPAAPPLPDPLPVPPDSPMSYLVQLDELAVAPELTSSQQMGLLAELRGLLGADDDDRGAAVQMLSDLRHRPDLTESVAREIGRLLEADSDESHERALDENVQFTIYRPRAIRPAEWYDLLAFAHLAERRPDAPADEPDPLAQVKAQAEQLLAGRLDDYDDPRSDSRHGVPLDGEITFLPEIPGVEFNPERRIFRWQEDVHREEFRLRAGSDLVGRTARGRLTVYLGVIILAEVDLALRVDPAAPSASATRPPPQPDQARPYRKIFASYSHRDVEVVRQFELLATSLGDEYLRDIARLRSGADWDEALLRLIDEADVFQLFWSSNSMRSPYVQREWEYAISLARPHFIRPTYWEDPLPSSRQPALPPDSLRRLHFSRIATAPRRPAPPAAAVSAAAPPVSAAPRRRGRIRAVIAPLAITLIAGTTFAGVMLSSLGTRTGSAPVPAFTAPSQLPTSTSTRFLPSPEPPPGDNPTSTLRRRIPAAIAATCAGYQLPDDTPIGAGLVGAVRCHPPGPNAPEEVWYFQYTDQESMSAAFAELTPGDFTPGDCRAPGQELYYTNSEARGVVGRLRCDRTQSITSFVWTHDRLRILSVAQDPALSFPALKSWWTKAGPYVDPSSQPR